MSTGLLIGIIVAIVVVVVVVAVLAAVAAKRRKRLREKFGPEYDRTVHDRSSKLSAERELEDREKRHADLDIRPLTPVARERYAQSWAQIQQDFVDQPNRAVVEADRVLTSLMSERGYPTEGFEQQLADLSVEHARTLENYRTARGIVQRQRAGEASTEELRAAMLHYRTLFDDLLDTGGQHSAGPAQQPPQQAQPPQQPPPQAQQQPPRQPPVFADDAPTPAQGQPRQQPPPPDPRR